MKFFIKLVFPKTKFSRSKTSFHMKYHMLYRIPKFCVKYQCGFLKYTLVFQNTSKIQNFLECAGLTTTPIVKTLGT